MDDDDTNAMIMVAQRGKLLAALLEVFPPPSSEPYGKDSRRYKELYKHDEVEELRGMCVARNSILMHKWRKLTEVRFRERGQSVARWQTLFELAVNKRTETLTSIGTRVGVAGPRLVGLLHELEADGLVERRPDPADGRAKILVLTPEGDELVSQMFDILIKCREEFLLGVEESEIRLMLDIVNRMSANLNRMIEATPEED